MKRKNFLHYPEYPGGKDELKRYISDNLIYPEEALREKISGTVWLSAVINDNGLVSEVVVEKGLGHGCDEEAVRLVSGLRYGGVNNRGLRLKVRHRLRIHFDLNGYLRKKAKETLPEEQRTVVYNYKPAERQEMVPEKSRKTLQPGESKISGEIPGDAGKNKGQGYGYTITIGRSAAPYAKPE